MPSVEPAAAQETIHLLPIEEVYRALGTGPAGLSDSEAARRRAVYGRNTIARIRGAPLAARLAAHFTHLMAMLLWAGGGIALAARLPQLAVAIWAVNLINGVFSFYQEYRAERATEALIRILPRRARVIRDGRERRIPAEDLVPGDLAILGEGDQLSADGRLVAGSELRMDQSTLTGESHPAPKTPAPASAAGLARVDVPNLVLGGSTVAAGTGRAVIFATGMDSEFGKVARLTQTVMSEPSPLQLEMAALTRTVSRIAIGVGMLFFALAVWLAGMDLATGFLFSLGMIVAFVPEGLLPTVTLALAMGVQRMARRRALVKRLSAVETLGCATVICTDKTGTLTQNQMTVRELLVAGRRLSVQGVGYDPAGLILEGDRPAVAEGDLAEALRVGLLCNDARLVPPAEGSTRWTPLGDPTEAALLALAVRGGLDPGAEALRAPRVADIPFASHRKCMTTLHAVDGRVLACVKGAPRQVLSACARTLAAGREDGLDEAGREAILQTADDLARSGLRVLALARRDLASLPPAVTAEAVERDLVFVALAAMMDPPRPEVAEAVEGCRRAGIRVIMITGDHGLTAESVGRQVGLLGPGTARIVSGAELDSMGDEQLGQALTGAVLFARVAPEHKLRVVRALQRRGEVVAVTGDGVNDAPALRQADIGVAMGMAGTDVAREAADVVLADDSFASIVAAVEEGRAVFANLRKFVSYIFTSNTPEAVPFVLHAFSGGRIPLALGIMQILSIDLGTDLLPALALGAEKPEPGVMDRPPRDRREHLVTPALLRRAYLWLGLLQSLAAMAAFYFAYWTHGYHGQWTGLPDEGALYRSATTMTLAAVVATQIGNLFAHRTELRSILEVGFFSNRLAWAGIAAEVGFLLLLVYVPFLQGVFGTGPIGPEGWLFVALWIPALLVVDEARKAVLRRSKGR